MEVIRIDSWNELATIPSRFKGGRWIYRGVGKTDYRLVTKIGRHNYIQNSLAEIANSAAVPFDLKLEKKIFEKYMRVARPHMAFDPRKNIEWLAVAQHHGFPTRFLDWTDSPFIAAYFAVRDLPIFDFSKEKKIPRGRGLDFVIIPKYIPGCIYAISAPEEVEERHETDPFLIADETKPRLYRPPHISPRVSVQNAVLTLHNLPNESWEPNNLVKFEIPGGKFDEIKTALNVVGVNEASLFPDLDGIGRHLGWQFEQGMI